MNKRLSLLMAVIFAFVGLCAYSQAPLSLPNPNVGNPNNYVLDLPGILSEKTKASINHRLADLRKKTTCEVAVAVVDTLDGLHTADYAYQLFKHWGLGKKDKNNGVLFLIAPSEKKAWIEVGSGAEGVLTDVACVTILRNYLRPAVHYGNVNQGVATTVDAIADALSDPKAADELRSGQGNEASDRIEALGGEELTSFIMFVALCVFICMCVLLCVDLYNTRKNENYKRAMLWRSHLSTYWWGAVLSCGTALPIALIALLLYKRARNVKEICETCGAKMDKLSEEEDNNYLTPSQDFEEKIGTVDYDVWLCPECGTIERFPYVEKQLKYQECPSCHTIAMNLMMDKVIEPPTTKREGLGERVYKCQYCRHIKREIYKIPRKDDGAGGGALLAGAALGAMAAGSRGGFSGGGGFGGGSSSGGGAGISWVIAICVSVGAVLASCGKEEGSRELAFTPYELSIVADGADSDSLRNIMEDFDGRWSVNIKGVLPVRLGKNDLTELRDSLCRLANLKINDKDKLEIDLPTELKAIEKQNKDGGKNIEKTPGSVLTHELSLDMLTPRFAVFRSYTYTYPEGAAHPAFANGYLNYDIEKGKIITYKMIFTEGFQKLIRVAIYERLEEQGINFLIDKNEFKVTNQFRLTPDGIEFIYGIYEIAPYSAGEPMAFFNYSELASILTPAGKEMFLSQDE